MSKFYAGVIGYLALCGGIILALNLLNLSSNTLPSIYGP